MNKKEVIKSLKKIDNIDFLVVGEASLVLQDIIIDNVDVINLACPKDEYEQLDWDMLNLLDDIKIKEEFRISSKNYKEDYILIDNYKVMKLDNVYDVLKSTNTDKKIVEKLDLYLATSDNYRYERELLKKNINLIAGVDEVGRGPLVGPVVASCVVMPQNYKLEGLTDSKKLSKKKREAFYEIIKKDAIGCGIGIVNEDIIDEINIYEATKIAMKKAIDECLKQTNIEHILIDAMKLDIDIPRTSIIKGDIKSQTISAASVIAKVTRDRMMESLDKKHPMYNFKNNMGYGTKEHLDAISKYGIIKEHRKTFGPVKEYLEKEKNKK